MGRYFGVPLEALVYGESCNVPLLVVNCATFICSQGLDVEGILRTNGNPRLLDKLRGSYNRTSTGDMHTADPVTVGGLLKVFLRELPDGLIPQQFTAQFVSAQETCSENPQECLRVMKQLLHQLPKPNYATLKFIIAFLVLVTHQEEVNKMNAMALAIVFGSILFQFVFGLVFLTDTLLNNA